MFQSSVLPWHNLYFAHWKSQVKNLLDDGVTLLPGKARICAIPVQLKDLWKIRAPVNTTQKVDLYQFDELIKVSFLFVKNIHALSLFRAEE